MANWLVVEASSQLQVRNDGGGVEDNFIFIFIFFLNRFGVFFSKRQIFEFIRDLIYKEFFFLVDNIVDLGFVEIIFVVCINLQVLWATKGLDIFFSLGSLYHSHFLKRVFLN